ncbi:MAG: ferrous iron transport protein [Phycisphaerales bacterium]|jgi:ferrous iron transport protein B|nr:ferrous iron transport protein [Phycisphaerales bacterium]
MPIAPSASTLTIALAGNPNSGKTTIFNALTGLRQKTANYPGVTVEKKTGRCKLSDGSWIDVIDLPGTYSLISRSPDERVAMEVLRGLRSDTPPPDVVVVVVDASNLQRNLYLVSQLIELGRPLVVALNMVDIAHRRGIHVSAETLSQKLGVPVVEVIGHKSRGIAELKSAIANAKIAPLPDWPLPAAMREEVMLVSGGLAIHANGDAPASTPLDRYQVTAERLLVGDRADDLAELAKSQAISKLLDHASSRLGQLGIDPMQADVEAHYRWIESVAHAATVNEHARGTGAPPVQQSRSDALEDRSARTHGRGAHAMLEYARQRTLTDKADAILIHKFWGLLTFAAIMGTLFVSIFFLADPIMGAVESGIGWLGGLVTGLLPAGPLQDLWKDGIVAGVGGVLVFVPQIALLFFFLAILEDSGYLARAAFLMDRLLSKVGLHGKSFIPLLSSFACAIPGIMATRTIENRRDRLATIFVAPFMSCSARLPVYALLIGAFFAGYGFWAKGLILLSLYGLGVVAAAATAWIFQRSLTKGPRAAFILEMPTYKIPQASQVARVVIGSTWAFIAKAGTIIFCLSVLLWALMYYPRLDETYAAQLREKKVRNVWIESSAIVMKASPPSNRAWTEEEKREFDANLAAAEQEAKRQVEQRRNEIGEQAVAAAQLRHSFAGRFGHAIEPVIRPLGYDWKMGVGLVGAFAAREVFVSTMGIVYSVGDDDSDTTPLRQSMKADRYPDGRLVWTPAVAASLLVWFVLAMQCMSTLAIVKRETNSWRWPLGMLLYMNALAYVAALVVYQIGSRIGA